MIGPFLGPPVGAAAPAIESCYTSSGAAGVLVLRSALMTRVQLVVERYTSLEHFDGVLVEQGLVDEQEQIYARHHFMLRPNQPLDVILPVVDVGPKKGFT